MGNLLWFLQVHIAVGHSKIRLYVDCRKVAERPIGDAGSPPTAGFITLGRLAKARGPRSSSATVSLGLVSLDGWALPIGPDLPYFSVPAPDVADHVQRYVGGQGQVLRASCIGRWWQKGPRHCPLAPWECH